jgi:hypothetical protein
MEIRALSFAAGMALIAVSANAQTPVSGTRDTVFAGGGAFNFTLKEIPDQNFCIPYAATNGNVPRGSAEAIAGWKDVVNQHTNLSFTDDGPVSPQICPKPGSHAVQGVGSNN